MSKGKAVYGGTFDPLTNGHLWLIDVASRAFDLMVVVATNPTKQPMFADDERVAIIREATRHLTEAGRAIDVQLLPATRFLAEFAEGIDAKFLVRGLRGVADLEAERAMQEVNRQFEVATIFLMGPSEVLNISSSFVRQLIGLDGWERIVQTMVPPATLAALKRRYTNG